MPAINRRFVWQLEYRIIEPSPAPSTMAAENSWRFFKRPLVPALDNCRLSINGIFFPTNCSMLSLFIVWLEREKSHLV